MEFVEGEPLSKVIEQRLSLSDPERLFLQMPSGNVVPLKIRSAVGLIRSSRSKRSNRRSSHI